MNKYLSVNQKVVKTYPADWIPKEIFFSRKNNCFILNPKISIFSQVFFSRKYHNFKTDLSTKLIKAMTAL